MQRAGALERDWVDAWSKSLKISFKKIYKIYKQLRNRVKPLLKNLIKNIHAKEKNLMACIFVFFYKHETEVIYQQTIISK